MTSNITKKLFQGFISLHILHHAQLMPVYGTWLLEELSEHGYRLSPGTLYPLLHQLEKDGLLLRSEENINGKIRKYYTVTENGKTELKEAKRYLAGLVDELGLKEI